MRHREDDKLRVSLPCYADQPKYKLGARNKPRYYRGMSDTDGLLPKIYGDLLSPSVRQVGNTLSSAVRVALSPAKMLLWTFEQAAEFAESRVRAVLEARQVPPENVQSPKVEIAAPVIQALRVIDQDETIRRLYLNLLATAMDSSRAASAHPAFVEVVKSLTPEEARAISVFTWLNAIGAPAYFPLIEVVAKLKGGGEVQVMSRFTDIGTRAGLPHELPASSIENLVRLGLGAVHLDRRMRDEQEYEPLLKHPWVLEMTDLAESRPDARTAIRRGVFEVTQFGFDFAHACTGGIECIGLNPLMLCETGRPSRRRP